MIMNDAIILALIKKSHRNLSSGSDSSDKNYTVIEQKVASDVWEINHNLNRYPNVIIIDSGENVVYGDIWYKDENNVVVTFCSPFSGKVILN